MPDWNAVFVPSTPVLEIFLRGTITFLVLMAMMRAAGQREAGGLGITDVFLVVLVAQAVAPGLVGESHSITDGVILAATVILWSLVLDAVAYRWPRLSRVIKARPRLLIEHGRLNHKVMRRELMTRSEVTVQLRLHGIEDISQVQRAYLEPNGMISILRQNRTETDEPARPEVL
ncbi:DUF421 domain-containing protein [Streptomyces cahuitamycinicus]|uniref:YetF C-terminal domain-containing protein n=1 Tax=Streptomyces cahuitamycinicus TaxID=2070367 RepID=A0A2N8TLQ4_9ACTN|nr:YetF domain-containing protein [Streptomyces cahuitamycinicus]PNG19946.1 hypothetical protein C1J00_22945 [Streptomyces cahuitamycinicus]